MKTTIRLASLALASAALLLGSCGNPPATSTDTNGLLTVNYADLSTEKADLPLSTFVENAEVIHIDNADEALYKAWFIAITDHYIGIRQSGAPFKLFDRNGKFLCDVGRVGNGPGEYAISIYDEIIDEKGGHVILSPFVGNKLMLYGLDGKWIRDIPLPFKALKPKIDLNADGTLSVVQMSMSEEDPIACCIDLEGNVLKQVPAPKHMLVSSADGEIFSNRNTAGEFEFFHTSCDTIFTYDAAANSLVPQFTVNFPDPDNKPIHIFRSTPQGYLVNCYYWDNEKGRPKEEGGGNFFIDRKTGKGQQYHLVNDFYGNIDAGVNFYKGYWYLNMEPLALKDLLTEHLASGDCPADARPKLEELAKTLHENDNNVLFIGKLKQ